jgi:hypothetical protein
MDISGRRRPADFQPTGATHWLVVRVLRPDDRAAPALSESAEDILDKRFARGEIDETTYSAQRTALNAAADQCRSAGCQRRGNRLQRQEADVMVTYRTAYENEAGRLAMTAYVINHMRILDGIPKPEGLVCPANVQAAFTLSVLASRRPGGRVRFAPS